MADLDDKNKNAETRLNEGESFALQIIQFQGLIIRGENAARELDTRRCRLVVDELRAITPGMIESAERFRQKEGDSHPIFQSFVEYAERAIDLPSLLINEANTPIPRGDDVPLGEGKPFYESALRILAESSIELLREGLSSRSAARKFLKHSQRLQRLAAELVRKEKAGEGLFDAADKEDNGVMERLERMESKIDRLAEAVGALSTSIAVSGTSLASFKQASEERSNGHSKQIQALSDSLDVLGKRAAELPTKADVAKEISTLRTDDGGIATKGWINKRLLAGAAVLISMLVALVKQAYWPGT